MESERLLFRRGAFVFKRPGYAFEAKHSRS